MPVPNFANRTLYHGDNLNFLRGMNSGTINLIATDPPFNKGRDFHATPDSVARGARFEDRWSWDKDVHPEWVDSIQDDWPKAWMLLDTIKELREGMAAFLCYIGVRLMEMHRILADDGTLYLHCDHTAGHYLKLLLDAIFGHENFRNEIVWCYSGGGQPRNDFPRKHDTILRYSKSDTYTFNRDEARIPYDSDYSATVFAGDETRAPGRTYRPDPKGKVVEDWWRNIPRPYGKERIGYPTQKPLALYERIIRTSSNEGDWVLDPFCGCATTPVAAERAERQWVGMDIWDEAHETIIKRLRDEGLAGPNGETDQLLSFGQIGYSTVPPVRTDDGEVAAPMLKTKRRIAEPPGPKLTRQEMVDLLIEENGMVCAGCDREFDDPLYLQLDHKTPRAEGGINHISNRMLLCGPCNRIKGDRLTLNGLRAENRKRGRMAGQTKAR